MPDHTGPCGATNRLGWIAKRITGNTFARQAREAADLNRARSELIRRLLDERGSEDYECAGGFGGPDHHGGDSGTSTAAEPAGLDSGTRRCPCSSPRTGRPCSLRFGHAGVHMEDLGGGYVAWWPDPQEEP